MKIAFTGPRHLPETEAAKVERDLWSFIVNQEAEWHVGDAPGLDLLIREAAVNYNLPLVIHEVVHKQRWGFAERSQRMIGAIATSPDSWLYAFPNKLCPEGCTSKNPFSGHGSGTWGTVAYAKKKNVNIYLFPLVKLQKLPSWLNEEPPKQLSLF